MLSVHLSVLFVQCINVVEQIKLVIKGNLLSLRSIAQSLCDSWASCSISQSSMQLHHCVSLEYYM